MQYAWQVSEDNWTNRLTRSCRVSVATSLNSVRVSDFRDTWQTTTRGQYPVGPTFIRRKTRYHCSVLIAHTLAGLNTAPQRPHLSLPPLHTFSDRSNNTIPSHFQVV
ncbi:hypothetical protein JHK82_053641 [Glycine max]|nr:hypothetical protein JHK86_053490 [Glycine max]KAG4927950.1 hypothetical protein JHK85_054436 [Glycine max]KAG5083473.1 hypothetical protein JHK84_053511 [Glycine max]KAG5086244.1 hypothetical protein JHK82_053641 [Glycine max]